MTPETFIARWRHADGSELANAQSFTRELCELLAVPIPDPARADTAENAYVFERRVTFKHGDGGVSEGRIDCYRRGAFVLEAKKLKQGVHTKGFDDGLLRARAQAEGYARALPAEEGRPPFLLVVDVGNVIQVYAEFSRSGATYTPYPDPRSYALRLTDLAEAPVRERLRHIWLDPESLDPARISARVTRDIATRLADVAKSLEADGHAAETVAGFLTRCLFSMFAEDVGLLPKRSFTDLLESLERAPQQFIPLVGELWRAMDAGEFSVALRAQLPRFNGKLFKDATVLPLQAPQIERLLHASRADWTLVEPAIFGTLLERALDPLERHALGAHYTPRPYVERLVLPTVIEPMRAEWADVQAAALVLAAEGRLDAARDAVHVWHHRLCQVRVLDPACGSGNFLYVSLEHMKRLEGEVLGLLDQLGLGQARFETEGLTVDPHQFLGLEINPRAAAIAELVLWIGHLQWHFRTRGQALPPNPILKDFRNIQCRDAVMAHDGYDYVTDPSGAVQSRWDGRTYKKHPVTGEAVPDETAQVPLERYRNPRPAAWPEADFVVGNPPFIGAGPMRAALGDGYVEALRGAWHDVPDSADFVMYWWHQAAQQARAGRIQRFGFITTNSIRQTFNRRVIEAALLPSPTGGGAGGEGATSAKRIPATIAAPSSGPSGHLPPVGEGRIHLAYAIPDHPWVDSADGAAVRIAMTVVAPGAGEGLLAQVRTEREGQGEGQDVELEERRGVIHADLTIGANVAAARALRGNVGVSQRGLELGGAGFIVTPDQAAALLPSPSGGGAGGEGATLASGITAATLAPSSGPSGHLPPVGEGLIRPYRNGRDLTDKPRGVLLIDAWGLTEPDLRQHHPAVWQWLFERVKPERDQNRDAVLRERWWLHRRLREDLRAMLAGLPRYIATVETAKHRVFQFLDAAIAPDNMLVCVAVSDAYALGVLSSRVHVAWALASGGTLEDRPRYNKTRCFETFPFPDPTPEQAQRIRALAEELDAHRKRQQAAHPDLTLTGMYNVLEALRAGRALSAKEKLIHEQGLVSLLKQLHDDLDAAVLAAYGWSDLLPSPAGGGAGGREGEFEVHAPSPSSGPGMQAGARPAREGATVTDEQLLHRLAALNAARAGEEAQGRIRWLRPAYQTGAPHPHPGPPLEGEGENRSLPGAFEGAGEPSALPLPLQRGGRVGDGVRIDRIPWPADLPAQVAAVAAVLRAAPAPLSEADIAARFTGKGPWKKRLPQLLETLAALGRARRTGEAYVAA